MKKFIFLLIAVILCVALTACGGSSCVICIIVRPSSSRRCSE